MNYLPSPQCWSYRCTPPYSAYLYHFLQHFLSQDPTRVPASFVKPSLMAVPKKDPTWMILLDMGLEYWLIVYISVLCPQVLCSLFLECLVTNRCSWAKGQRITTELGQPWAGAGGQWVLCPYPSWMGHPGKFLAFSYCLKSPIQRVGVRNCTPSDGHTAESAPTDPFFPSSTPERRHP